MEVDNGSKIKKVVDGILLGLRWDFPSILEAPQLWTVISAYLDWQFIHNVLKTYLLSTVRFCEAFYHGTKEEKISSRGCFFKNNVLQVTSCIFPSKGESSSKVAVRLCGGRKMLDVHDLGQYMRYSVKRAILMSRP